MSLENMEVFEDTIKLCETNGKIRESIAQSVKNQKLIPEWSDLPDVEKRRFPEHANIIVSAKRTFEAASAYAGQKTAVHNFASSTNPGGGVTRGSSAQEECLCRCSGLYFCLRLARILDVAASKGDEVVILGAFGCGAFRNKPEVVARAAKEVIADYLHAFKTIEFAVYCPPQDNTNFKVFKRVIGA